MTVAEKKAFINSLTENIAAELRLKAENMPEEWDGHELRSLLAEKFQRETTSAMRDKRSRRYRSYEEECITRNL